MFEATLYDSRKTPRKYIFIGNKALLDKVVREFCRLKKLRKEEWGVL